MNRKLAGVFVVTAVCLGWVLSRLDLSAAAESFVQFRWSLMAPVWAIYGACHLLRSWRLRSLLGRPIPLLRLFSILSIGYLAIHVVPLRMGEFVRPYLLREKEGIPFGAALAAVFLERLVDVLMLLGMLFIVAFGVDLPVGALVVNGVDLIVAGQRAAGAVVVLGVGGLVGMVMLGETLLSRTDRTPIGGLVRRFREGLLVLARTPGTAALVLFQSVVIWVLTVWAVQLTMVGFVGMPATFGDALTTWTVTLTGMTALPTPGFFGGYEAACTAVVTVLGARSESAGAFALILHLSQFIFTVLVGVIFLAVEGLSLRDVVGRSRELG